MRRIYLQSLKRGDSPGRGGGRIFGEQTTQQCPQKQMDPGILQVLSLATEEEAEVCEWEWAGLNFGSVIDHSPCHHW